MAAKTGLTADNDTTNTSTNTDPHITITDGGGIELDLDMDTDGVDFLDMTSELEKILDLQVSKLNYMSSRVLLSNTINRTH